MNVLTTSNMPRCRSLFALASLIAATTTPAFAGQRHVPSQYRTIQAAIDASVDGDEVVLADGVYTGAGNKNLFFNGRDITVRSASGIPATCTINCQNSGNAFNLPGGETSAPTISGLTITNANDGISAFGGNTTITNCLFTSNHPAIFGQSAPVAISDCAFIGNSGDFGGAVSFFAGASASITDCTFEGNSAFNRGGGIYFVGTTLTLTNCDFINNAAQGQPSTFGGSVALLFVAKAVISQCAFLGNHTDGKGGGISMEAGVDLHLVDCLFSGNTAAGGSGGAMDIVSANTRIANCTFYGNTSGINGGGIAATNATPRITNCILWDNSPQQVSHTGSGALEITYSDVQGGFAGSTNINVNPNFIDPNGADNILGTADDDLRVASGSPVIDTGNNVPFHFRSDAAGWLRLRPAAKSYAFDQFKPGIAGDTGCTTNGDWAPTLPLDGGTVELWATGSTGIIYCPITDGSSTPAVSDGSMATLITKLRFDFDPPVTAFHTYYGSLASSDTATMRLFNGATQIAQYTCGVSADNVDAIGHGFSSLVPITNVEITSSDTNLVVGAFVGLASGETSLGTINIPGYSGPTGATVQKDFGVVFGSADLPGDLDGALRVVNGDGNTSTIVDMGAYEFNPCPADLNGDGAISVLDLLAVINNWGATGPNAADINHDGTVSVLDLLMVINGWGACA